MEHSPTIAELAKALSKAQGEMENPRFDSENPHFKSRYASLAAVRDAVIPVLSANGLSVIQPLTSTETGIKCGVFIMHDSGEWLSLDPLDVPASKLDAQGFVSAATYAKRTTMQSAFCVVGDGDDDGNVASAGKPEKKEEKPPEKPTPPGKISTGQVKFVQTLFTRAGYKEDLDKHAYATGVTNRTVTSILDLTSKEARAVIEALQKLTGAVPAL